MELDHELLAPTGPDLSVLSSIVGVISVFSFGNVYLGACAIGALHRPNIVFFEQDWLSQINTFTRQLTH